MEETKVEEDDPDPEVMQTLKTLNAVFDGLVGQIKKVEGDLEVTEVEEKEIEEKE